MEIKDMVYIMNVDWNWIKQRPHFIAELLSDKFNIHVMYQYRYGRKGLQKRKTEFLDVKPIYVIPRGDRYKCLAIVNSIIKMHRIRYEIKRQRAEILYLTYPNQVNVIEELYKGCIVYDCMDNHPAFIKDGKEKQNIIRQESMLVSKADIIFVSSLHLKMELLNRYGKEFNDKIYLVRNGYNGEIVDVKDTYIVNKNELYTIAYFGTISSWFDFESILKSLNDFQDIQYELYGPIDGIEIPKHERIHYHGTIEHNKLLENVRNVDCFAMPFVVNEIIESVDPVKLYEYINFNKDILAPYYQEIERFDKFVCFYKNYDEFKGKINELKSRKCLKYNNKEREAFLTENSWKCRIDIIKHVLSQNAIIKE